MAEQFALVRILIDDLLRAADKQAAVRRRKRRKIGTRDVPRAKMRRRMRAKISGVMRIECIHRILRIVGDMHVGGDAELQLRRSVPGLQSGAAVKLGQRRKLRRRQADIGKRQRQTERARPFDAARRAAGPDPDRQPVLRRARRDWRVVQSRAEAALPGRGAVELDGESPFPRTHRHSRQDRSRAERIR